MYSRLFIAWFIAILYLADGAVKSKVVYTAVLFRHGDRTPVAIYPTDPNKEETWKVGLGQLTNEGKLRMYNVGIWLKERYGHLVGDGYNYKTITVNSSDVDRAIMSAQLVLAGMYPPRGDQVWNNTLNWQPIPVHTIPPGSDNMIAFTSPCDKYNAELKATTKLPAVQKLFKKYETLFKYTAEHAGYNFSEKSIKEFDMLLSIQSSTSIEMHNNRTVPDWVKPVFDELTEASAYPLLLFSYTPLLQRLRAGPLLKSVVDYMSRVESGEQSLKNITLYSGHDYVVASVLAALGAFNMKVIPFGALILFDLLKTDDNDYIIEVSYRNSTSHEPHKLSFQYCPEPCKLEAFKTAFNYLLPEDWDEECIVTSPASGGVSFIVVAVFGVGVAIVVIALAKYCMNRRRTNQNNYEVY